MPRFGLCVQCRDNPQEDMDEHVAKLHRGREVTDPEIYSGTIQCKVCMHAIKRPRLAPGKVDTNEVPKHNCEPAHPVKNDDGFVTGWVNSLGMDSRHYQLVLDPIQ